jgi:2-amino-4-hydroxy-6-hydroxymethyldihydropteridine diphosphokinase
VGKVVRISTFISTEPWGFESPNSFLNGVICCQTSLTPREVLQVTQEIERKMGRLKLLGVQPPNRQYEDRIIDIDILLYDDWQVDEPDLKIPHPLMQERDFVMIPLNEIRNETT